jgi:branched-chain amino acid transport system substrate-binding protein
MAHAGASSLRGVELKLEKVGYEVAGRKIEFSKENGAFDPVVYVDKARKLVEHDKVDVALGPLLPPVGFTVASYLTESRTANITFHVHSV